MSTLDHLERLQQGVEIWNQWRENNLEVKPDLRGTDLIGANLSDADLSGVNLRGANLSNANLSGVNLSDADLSDADLRGTNLIGAYLSETDLSEADLIGAYLWGAYLWGANLSDADLSDADLKGANLIGANLSDANLSETNLSKTQALTTNFDRAIFTGACLEDWNINSATSFEGTIYEYIYLKHGQQERRPRKGNFKPGEFAALFQQAVDTVDLIFKDGIDWQAFFQSFQELRSQYANNNLSIQAIERKQGEAFVIRLAMSSESDKTAIESRAREFYAAEVRALENQYEERLRLQGQHLEDVRKTIEVERRDKASLMAVMSTMASTQQGPKYDMRGAQIAGGVADTVQGDQHGGIINHQTSEASPLAEAVAEIQSLLKQLEASNPTATEAEQTAYLSAMIPPTRRERFIGALKSAGDAAIEEVPYGAVLKALVEGWQKPGG